MTHLAVDRALELTSALAVTSQSLFDRVGRWSADSAHPATCGAFATLSRHLGEHAVWWAGVRPESVLLADTAAARPDLLLDVDAEPDPGTDPERVTWLLTRVLPSIRPLVDELAAPGGPEAAPFRRVARWVQLDLDAALQALSTLRVTS